MPGTVVGTQMGLGYPGTFSRNGDCIIDPRLVTPTDTANINFGDAVVLIENSVGGYWSQVAGWIAGGNTVSMTPGSTGTVGTFAGFAIREVMSFQTYLPSPTLAFYAPGQQCDVIVRGNVVVNAQNPSAAAFKSGGNVYLRVSAGTGTVIGAIEPAADGAHTVQLTNCQFQTGLTSTDPNGNLVVELCLTSRNVA